MMKHVAIIGTQGVPANYGGFETLVENIIGDNCSSGISYTIFCSSKDLPKQQSTYKGAKLKYIPLHANGIQSILYDIISLLRVMSGYDVILILGTSGCAFLPVFRLFCHKKLIINIDGAEHRREKWGSLARWFLRFSEAVAVKYADVIIADNKGIQDYVLNTYHKTSELIAYGGDHVLRTVSEEEEQTILNQYKLISKQYAIAICRIEPENNCHVILEAFSMTDKKLLFIGNWDKNAYGKELERKYGDFDNITMVHAIYDLDILYVLRKNAEYYIHGHSAGGTNPSLVEAMFCGCNIIAYDVIYNKKTTENKAYYFHGAADLKLIISKDIEDDGNSRLMYEIANKRYTWVVITKQYESLY